METWQIGLIILIGIMVWRLWDAVTVPKKPDRWE